MNKVLKKILFLEKKYWYSRTWIEVLQEKIPKVHHTVVWHLFGQFEISHFIISCLAHLEMDLKLFIDKKLLNHLDKYGGAYDEIPKDTLYCDACPYQGRSLVAKFFYGYQSAGYCYLENKGDFSFFNGTTILWDGCKACNINMWDGEDEE